jgi:transcriptional regulator with XRE-family HTH domain
MTTFDIVKKLADKQKISIVELEERLDFSKNSLYAWKKSKPSIDKLEAVANFFNVSTDYLLGREEKEHQATESLDEMIDNAMFYDGKPLSDTDREIVKAFLEGKFGSK